MAGLVIFGAFLDVVKDVVDGFFGVIARDGVFDVGEKFGIVFSGLKVVNIKSIEENCAGNLTLSYKPSLNSNLIACFRPLNPQSPFSFSNAGTPKNSSMAASGSVVFICFAL